MTKAISPPRDREQALRELATRERKLRDKWLSFKKRLRANKSLDPDYADALYRQSEATFDGALQLLEGQREKLLTRAPEL